MNDKAAKINELAQRYQGDMTRFLRDLIAIPGESGGEKQVIERIRREMEKVGFDRIEIDPMGNILGYLGTGGTLIAMDAHVDTVGVGERSNWEFDPYQGLEDDERIYGRGASDQLGGMASMVYAAKMIRELELEGDFTLLVTGTVQEEDCDGLCWQYIIDEDGIRPEFVVLTEPTDGGIYRGQRGRMEIKITTSGVSAHGSAPERGENAIYKMAPILAELEELNTRLANHDFLGAGTLTVSEIFSGSPSRCAVADQCRVSVDRRLTWGETADSAMEEIRNLPAVKRASAEVQTYTYEQPSWRGLVYPSETFFPAWMIDENHPACRASVEAYEKLFDAPPRVDKWTFSTNGVSIMGRYGIPCIGFGPGKEAQAHAPNERTWKQDLVRAAAFYAALPGIYMEGQS